MEGTLPIEWVDESDHPLRCYYDSVVLKHVRARTFQFEIVLGILSVSFMSNHLLVAFDTFLSCLIRYYI